MRDPRRSRQYVQAGDGAVIVQIEGDGSTVNVNQPHLELMRRSGLSRRIGNDPETGKPVTTDLIRPFARAIELVGREMELDSLRRWLKSESPISVRVLTGDSGLGKTRLALELARISHHGSSELKFQASTEANSAAMA